MKIVFFLYLPETYKYCLLDNYGNMYFVSLNRRCMIKKNSCTIMFLSIHFTIYKLKQAHSQTSYPVKVI